MSDAQVSAQARHDSSPQVWRPSFNPWLIAASVMFATFMEVLDTSVANVALPHIAGTLSATTEESTWVLTSYLVSNAIVLPTTNWMGHRFGRKRFLIVCVLIFTASSAVCGAASSLGMLLFARVVQGAGGGALQPIAQAVLLESFPREKRGSAMALYGMGIVVAPIIGPTLGGWITDNYSWRWIFYINVPIGITAALMSKAFVEDAPYIRNQRPGQIDYIGFGLMALGLATLQILLDKGQELDWFSSSFITSAAVVSAISLIAFVVWELRTPEPIVNLRVLANRNFALGTALIALMGVVLYGTTVLMPLLLQTLLGYPALESGLAVSPRGIGAIVSMVIVGRLVGRLDARYLAMFGFCVLAVATFLLSDISLDISMSSIVWPQIVSGFAMGFIFVPLTILATGTLRNDEIGNATGVYALMRNLGGSVGIAGVTTMLARNAQIHQTMLLSHLTPYDAAFQQRLHELTSGLAAQLDPVTATQTAYGVIYQTVVTQASLLSYVDAFEFLAFLCLLACLAPLFFKRVKAKPGTQAMH